MEPVTYLRINPADSVVVCLQPKKAGDIVDIDGRQVVVNQDIPAGHKLLIEDTTKGQDIIKYGYPIGHATEDLKAGDLLSRTRIVALRAIFVRTEPLVFAMKSGLCLPWAV